MSADVGVSKQRGRATQASKLREALTGAPELRGADRILAESFWRASPPARVAQASRVSTASVLSFPLRRT